MRLSENRATELGVGQTVRYGRWSVNLTTRISDGLRLLRDVKSGIEQLDGGEYTEYGVDSQQQFLADIETEERSRFSPNPPQ